MVEYDEARKPVAFIEQAVDNPIDSSRRSAWWSAYGAGGSVSLPLIMVDSGNQISNGYVDFETVYKGMIDSALSRAPGAAINAVVDRVGDRLHFSIDVTNLSGVTLSSSNYATLYAIVYDYSSTSGLTGSYAVASSKIYLPQSLVNGASETYSLETGDLTDVNWSSLGTVVFLDYRPAGSIHYDMLQAALEIEPKLESAMKSLLIVSGQHPSDTHSIEDINNDQKIGIAEAIHFLQQETR